MQLGELIEIVKQNTEKARWTRGYTYYKKGIVSQAEGKINKGILKIEGVIGSDFSNEIYYTTLEIDLKKKEIIVSRCNCIDFKNNEYENSKFICKHIVATFLLYIENLQKEIKQAKLEKKKKEEEQDPSNQILSIVEQKLNQKERLTIEVYLDKKENQKTTYYQAYFKIGNNKMYVLKNLKDFVEARNSKIELRYGKDLNYNPTTHYFSGDDELVVSFIEEYVSIDKLYSENTNNFKTIDGKFLNILESGLKKFLLSIGSKEVTFIYDKKEYTTNIVKDNIDIDFLISESDEVFKLTSNINDTLALTTKGDVFLYKDKIYLIPEKQYDNYMPFYKFLSTNGSIDFKKKDANKLFNEVMPILQRASENVNLDDNLQKQVKQNFKTEFYFDKEDSRIVCDIKYIYTDNEGKTTDDSSGYIIRNIKKEKEIEDILCDYGFNYYKNKFAFFKDEYSEYEFFKDKIENLKDYGDVYYSDRLKNMKVYKSVNIKANFSLLAQNYLDFNFEIEDIDKEEYKDILKAFRDKRKFFKLKNNSFLDLEEEQLNKFLNLLDKLDEKNLNEEDEASYILTKGSSLYIEELLEDEELSFIKGKEDLKKISQKFKSMCNIEAKVPNTLNATLREYQVSGLQWFKTVSHFEFGGILADEMGLGKTIQTITFLLSEKSKKSIIVTPTSLIYNWKNEFDNFAPSLDVLVLHGNKNERASLSKYMKDADVILTTYGVLKNDFEEYKDMEFDYCIIDEAQNIKNPYSQSSEVVKDINAKVKFALTGTPIENNLVELWSIFDFIMPGYLYSKNRFKDKFIKEDANYEDLKKQIQPFILRRLKKDVLSQLPDKIETKFFVEMTPEQKKTYQAYTDDIIEKMKNTDLKKDKMTILSYLTTLRQLCLDPSIRVNDYDGGSGKIEVLKEIVHENIKGNHKILIFSQFTSVLKNIGKEFEKENIQYYYLDGSTNAKDRIELVDDFNKSEEVSVFLISLKAGGTGLNLTGADIVIHFDPWWNPAIENQATDRAHRYGQENIVEVIKLIAKGTIEEKIVKLQESKKELIDKVISDDLKNESLISLLSEEEFLQLLSN